VGGGGDRRKPLATGTWRAGGFLVLMRPPVVTCIETVTDWSPAFKPVAFGAPLPGPPAAGRVDLPTASYQLTTVMNTLQDPSVCLFASKGSSSRAGSRFRPTLADHELQKRCKGSLPLTSQHF